MLLMLKVSKVSNSLLNKRSKRLCQMCQRCTVLCIQRPLTPPGGKACKAFYLVGLVVHHQSVQGGSFINFLGLSTTRVIAGKTHSQFLILKLTMGALSNQLILTYVWEQSCILHTLKKLPACNLEPKSSVQCLNNMHV